MRSVSVRLWRAALLGVVAALVLAVSVSDCDTGRPGSPFVQRAHVTRTTLAPNACTRAYGQCEVTEYRYHLRNGTIQIWTCFAQPPVRPGASNVAIAVNDCFRP